jgi:Skp family chaperone for outer membrane proteins
LALLVGALMLAAPLGHAQEAQPLYSSILTLDQERLFNGSRVAQRVSEEIERRMQELAAENREIEADLNAQELDLTQRRSTLPPTEFRALADAFDEKVQAIRVQQDEKERALLLMQEQEQQNFLRRISPVLAEIVRERRAVVVLDRRTVFLSADTVDITDEAIARINAALDAEANPAPAPELGPEPEPEPEPGPAPEPAPPAEADALSPAQSPSLSEDPAQTPEAPVQPEDPVQSEDPVEPEAPVQP